MFLVYIDDSGDERVRCFSALVVHETKWREIQQTIRAQRREMKRSDGILIAKELHATEFVSGRGRLGPSDVHKGRRCELFNQTLGWWKNSRKYAFSTQSQDARRKRFYLSGLLTESTRLWALGTTAR